MEVDLVRVRSRRDYIVELQLAVRAVKNQVDSRKGVAAAKPAIVRQPDKPLSRISAGKVVSFCRDGIESIELPVAGGGEVDVN